MSQATDYDVANASGASVRADLNTILLAIASLNAGTAAPSTTYANMLWVDTTNSLLKKRNNANSAWVQLGPMDNRLEGRVPILTKSAGYTAAAADRGSLIDFTTAGVTLAYTAAATLGADWYVYVRNSAGSGVVTHDPNSTEQIDGATTLTQQPGEAWLVICDGTGFKTVGRVSASTLIITSTDSGASEAPDLDLFRDSASPAASDVIGGVQFNGRDSAANKQIYARLRAIITDPTSTSEDAKLIASTVVAGAETDILTLTAGAQIGAPTSGDMGAGTLNAAANAAATALQQNGKPAGLPLLQILTASTSASLLFTGANNTLYRGYLCVLHKLLPATNGVDLWLRASTDQGSSLRSGTEYTHARVGGTSAAATGAAGSGSDTKIVILSTMSNGGRGATGTVFIEMGASANDMICTWNSFHYDGTGMTAYAGGGENNQASVNGFGFLMSSGNITSGTIYVYGIPKV